MSLPGQSVFLPMNRSFLARQETPEPLREGSPAARQRGAGEAGWTRLVGESESLRQLDSAIQRVADFGCPVLITGETGCGKEEVARAIHAAGPRRDRPFIAVNCGGIVAALAESQLFGHERGSFTGAFGASRGVFRSADGGIVFLDEIGEMPLELQPKLLRILQRREVTPVGSTDTHPVDVQVVAATNRDLTADAAAQRFREDLLYRLNTIHLGIPPLRACPEDIPRFIDHFSAHFARLYDRPQWRPDGPLLGRLLAYSWPGNVRQLLQFVQRAYVFEDRLETVVAELLHGQEEFSRRGAEADVAVPAASPAPPSDQAAAARTPPPVEPPPVDPRVPVFNLAELRRLAVRQALAAADGHRGRAAALLGVSPGTMSRLAEESCPEIVPRTGRPRRTRPRQPR
jgi:DNA-binding NtrC family response regulator